MCPSCRGLNEPGNMSSGLLLLLDINPTLLLNNFTHDFSALTLFIDISSSISGIVAGWNTAEYNSSKAGVRLLSKSVALYCAKKGYDVRCNSIHPAFVDTPILDPLKQAFGEENAVAKLSRQIPMNKIGDTDDVSYAILYLASDESKFMTGTEIVLDGGLSAM